MSLRQPQIDAFMTRHDAVALVQVEGAQGSVPREPGAFMLVSADGAIGTIGGGQLEFIAIDAACAMLRNVDTTKQLDVPLGPEIGQCCGGRVQLVIKRVDGAVRSAIKQQTEKFWQSVPWVYVFGAGHVGRALADGLARLPFHTVLIDTRPDVFDGLPAQVDVRQVVLPEAEVRAARSHSAFVVLTHDHALDFMIMGEVLKREDAVYAGMIGSKSKRAQFARWFRQEGGALAPLERLICPIGAQLSGDKRPEIIAALVAAEIIGKYDENDSAERAKSANLLTNMGVVHGA